MCLSMPPPPPPVARIHVPAWDTGIVNPANPAYEFVKRFTAGRAPIIWKDALVTVRISDPDWLSRATQAVSDLPRADLCVLYTYTTQVYHILTTFLRDARVPDGMVHDPTVEWRYGEEALRDRADTGDCLTRGHDTEDDALCRFDVAWALPRSAAKYRTIAACYAALRPYFTATFKRTCRERCIESNPGLMFYTRAESGLLSDFKRTIPRMRAVDWARCMRRFVRSLDGIFDRMPPCRTAFYVYRGTSPSLKPPPLGDRDTYTSTSLSPDVARQFAGRHGTVTRILVPPGSKVIPLIAMGRYEEQEILLPRHGSRGTA